MEWIHIASISLDSQSMTSSIQKAYIFAHPIEYIFMIIRTYIKYLDLYILNIFFGNQLYHWQLKVYPFFSIVYVIVIVSSLFFEKANFKLNKLDKIIIILIAVIIIVLISTALFVQNNTGTNDGVIGGIQARYFIPICLLSLLLINVKKVKIFNKLIFELFMLLYFPAILTIVVRFI